MLEAVKIGTDGADFQRQTVEHHGLRRQSAITDIIDMPLGDLDQSRQTFLAQYPGRALNLGQQPRHVLEQGRARRVFDEAFDGLLDRAEINVSLVGDDAEQLLVIRFGQRGVACDDAVAVATGGAGRIQRVQILCRLPDLSFPVAARTRHLTGVVLDEQQRLGQWHGDRLRIRDALVENRACDFEQLVRQLLERRKPEHLERAADTTQVPHERIERDGAFLLRVEVRRQQVLRRLDFLGQHRGHRLQRLGRGHVGLIRGDGGVTAEQGIEVEGTLKLGHQRAAGSGMRHFPQHGPGQCLGAGTHLRFVGAIDELFNQLVESRQQLLTFDGRRQPVLGQPLQQAARNPKKLLNRRQTGAQLQALEDNGDIAQRLPLVRVAQPTEQQRLERRALLFGEIDERRIRQPLGARSRQRSASSLPGVVADTRRRRTHREVGGEQIEF